MRRKINMKKTADTLLALFVVAGALSLAWLGLRNTGSVPASAPPMDETSLINAGLVVVLDAGHGGPDCGATGTETGIEEAGLNLSVAELTADILTKNGATVVMTRSSADSLGKTKAEDMKERSRIMNLDGVDLVVSIHMNKFTDRSVSGPMVFYMRGSEAGKEFASVVLNSLCESLNRPKRLANPEDLFVLREPSAPSVLVECGFLSNPQDEQALMKSEYQKKLAEAISRGILEYAASIKNGSGYATLP